jgi:hypothetical protein
MPVWQKWGKICENIILSYIIDRMTATIDTTELNELIEKNNNVNDNLNVNQPAVLGIINNENTRLDEKQKAVNNMKFEQERVIHMNRNMQERTAAFNQILIVLFVSLAIMIIIIFIGRFVPFFEPFVIFLCVIVVSIGVCYSIYLYLLLTQRHVNDYDLLNLYTEAKPANSTTKKDGPLDASDEFNKSIDNCSGAACCDTTGTEWNGSVCVKSGFATLTDAYGYSDYISSQTEPVSVNNPVNLMPVQASAQSCQNPIAYPSQYPKA